MPALVSIATLAAGVGVLISLFMMSIFTDTQKFLPGACDRVDGFISGHVVGQDMAVSQLVEAVCTHLKQQYPSKPLIISVHGPPGVGKTYTHTLLARALYNTDPKQAIQCPGEDCRGAKVIYGLDFMLDSREQQLSAVRSAILQHARNVADPLIVIEEYDKLDCPTRGMLRQLLESPDVANVTLNKAIILLESNLGFSELEQLVEAVGRDKITAEQAEKALRSLVFSSWQAAACETYPDTLKLISLIDFFLPYLPLQREQVEELMVRSLHKWSTMLWHEKLTQMEWGRDVVAFLTNRVDFDGPYPLEGGKQVSNVATRYLSRLVRKCPLAAKPPAGKGVGSSSKASGTGEEAVSAWRSGGMLMRGPGAVGSPIMKLVVQDQALGVAV